MTRTLTKTFAENLLATRPVEAHPLMVALADGSLPLAQAQHIALELGSVVATFPRFLAGVTAQIDRWQDRMDLVNNLYEEHGHMRPERVHEVTYWAFVRSLGVTDAQIAAHRPGLGATVYCRAILDLCCQQAPAEALGALGVIEEIVARASLLVGRYAEGAGIAKDRHFSVHESLDLEHADELYTLAERMYGGTPQGRAAIDQGARLGHYHHMRLYTDVLAEARQQLNETIASAA